MWKKTSTRTLLSPGGGKVLGGLGFFASAFRLVRVGLLVGLVVSGFIFLVIGYDLSNHINPLWNLIRYVSSS